MKLGNSMFPRLEISKTNKLCKFCLFPWHVSYIRVMHHEFLLKSIVFTVCEQEYMNMCPPPPIIILPRPHIEMKDSKRTLEVQLTYLSIFAKTKFLAHIPSWYQQLFFLLLFPSPLPLLSDHFSKLKIIKKLFKIHNSKGKIECTCCNFY